MTIERQKNRKGGKRLKDYRESKSLFNAFMKRSGNQESMVSTLIPYVCKIFEILQALKQTC